jgi:hypothetical protein
MDLTNDDSLFEFGDQPQRAGHRRNKAPSVLEEGTVAENRRERFKHFA